MPVVHHPFSFDIGPLQFTGFGIAVLMAFAIAQIVTQRELALFATQSALIRVQAEQRVQRVNLHLALGGSFEKPPPPPPPPDAK